MLCRSFPLCTYNRVPVPGPGGVLDFPHVHPVCSVPVDHTGGPQAPPPAVPAVLTDHQPPPDTLLGVEGGAGQTLSWVEVVEDGGSYEGSLGDPKNK